MYRNQKMRTNMKSQLFLTLLPFLRFFLLGEKINNLKKAVLKIKKKNRPRIRAFQTEAISVVFFNNFLAILYQGEHEQAL